MRSSIFFDLVFVLTSRCLSEARNSGRDFLIENRPRLVQCWQTLQALRSPLHETLLDWLRACDDAALRSYGLVRSELTDRTVPSRRAIGDYFATQLSKSVAKATHAGLRVEILSSTSVDDIRPNGRSLQVVTDRFSQTFTCVIVATGHPALVEGNAPHFFQSPYGRFLQASREAANIGILGSSLSAWDAALVHAEKCGKFLQLESGETAYRAENVGFQITMMSRTGMLPNIDFYFRYPFDPPIHMTDQALDRCCRSQSPLDEVFNLFKLELLARAPEQSLNIGLQALTPESFADAYFKHRLEMNPFDWFESGLAVAEFHSMNEIECPWKSTILSVHERFEKVIPFFSAEDRLRFDKGMKRIFSDNYAAVPTETVRKLLALRKSNHLELRRLGEDYVLLRGANGMSLRCGETELYFDFAVDARGQCALRREHIPFRGLRDALCLSGLEVEDLGDDCSFPLRGPYGNRLVFVALPFLLHTRPFGLGLGSCAALGKSAAERAMGQLERSSGDLTWIAP